MGRPISGQPLDAFVPRQGSSLRWQRGVLPACLRTVVRTTLVRVSHPRCEAVCDRELVQVTV